MAKEVYTDWHIIRQPRRRMNFSASYENSVYPRIPSLAFTRFSPRLPDAIIATGSGMLSTKAIFSRFRFYIFFGRTLKRQNRQNSRMAAASNSDEGITTIDKRKQPYVVHCL